jgi:hypothetical protein
MCLAYFVAGIVYYVRAAEELGNSRRMDVKEALLRLGHAVAAPVDLYKLWQLALLFTP